MLGSSSIRHDPLGLSLRSKLSLCVGGSEPGAPVPLRSMSDPDQDFDKEVCVPQHRRLATQGSTSYVGESTRHLSPQGQPVES